MTMSSPKRHSSKVAVISVAADRLDGDTVPRVPQADFNNPDYATFAGVCRDFG